MARNVSGSEILHRVRQPAGANRALHHSDVRIIQRKGNASIRIIVGGIGRILTTTAQEVHVLNQHGARMDFLLATL